MPCLNPMTETFALGQAILRSSRAKTEVLMAALPSDIIDINGISLTGDQILRR